MAKCILKIKMSALKRQGADVIAGSPSVPEGILATAATVLDVVAETAASAPALSPWTAALPNQGRVKVSATFEVVDTVVSDVTDPDAVVGEMLLTISLGVADEALAEIGDPTSAFNEVCAEIVGATNDAFGQLGQAGTDYLAYLGMSDPVEQITFTRRIVRNIAL